VGATSSGAEIQSIGLIEVSSVATGYQVEDTMLKAASDQASAGAQHLFRQIPHRHRRRRGFSDHRHHGRRRRCGPRLIEQRQIARVHPSVLQAISMSVEYDVKQLAPSASSKPSPRPASSMRRTRPSSPRM
jgi:hypothetical protein